MTLSFLVRYHVTGAVDSVSWANRFIPGRLSAPAGSELRGGLLRAARPCVCPAPPAPTGHPLETLASQVREMPAGISPLFHPEFLAALRAPAPHRQVGVSRKVTLRGPGCPSVHVPQKLALVPDCTPGLPPQFPCV